MGLGKSEKGGKWCRGRSRPQWGSGAKPLVVVWGATPPEAESFFQYVITKNSILEHENQIFASQWALWLDQIFTWPFSKLHWECHYGAQKIYLQKSVMIWQQQPEVLQKLGYFFKKKKNQCELTHVSKYILVSQPNIFWYSYSILFNLSATTKGKSLCVKGKKNRNSST